MDTHQNLLGSDQLQVTPQLELHLKETAMWARFLAILGFVFSGILLLLAVFSGTIMNKFMNSTPYQGAAGESVRQMMSGMVFFIYFVFAVIGVIISVFLLRFGIRIKRSVLTNDQETFNSGFKNLKFVFRFYGIVMIVYLGCIAVALIGSLAAIIMAR